jgi:hypothetical protein
MSIYNHLPYTYIIGWSQHDTWYYGVRYSVTASPNDLWKTYFTSSDYVKNFRKQYGEPDVVSIRRTFDTKDKAISWEHKVLRRMRVKLSDRWLNKNDCSTPPVMIGEDNPFYGKKHSEEVLNILRNNYKTEESREKLRKPKEIISEKSIEHKKNISLSHLGIGHNYETKNFLSKYSEKYSYTIENIFTEEVFETTNLTNFCRAHKGPQHNNLVKTWAGYGGKKRMKHTGGFRIVSRKLLQKRIVYATIEHIQSKTIFENVDFYEFCRDRCLSTTNLRRTSNDYMGNHKSYTVKGYRLIKLY